MQFVYPSFLYALGLLAIPILIHLFNFRRYKRVVFSDIRFLQELTEQNKKQQRLKEWLILLARVLAISFLVFAFAQPYIPGKIKNSGNRNYQVSIYVDNSFSMQAAGKEGALLDQAKTKARKLVDAFGANDEFQLITNDFEGKHQRLVNQKEFLQMLDEVSISPTHRNLSEINQRQKSLWEKNKSATQKTYFISDFQENMEPNSWEKDSLHAYYLVPLAASQQQNVWIDSAWLEEPFLKKGNQNKLKVKLRNGGENSFENQALVLKIDGIQKVLQNFSCNAGESKVLEMNFSLSDYQWHGISLSITDYPIVFDDSYFLAVQAKEFVSILTINDAEVSPAIKKVYGLDSIYALKEQSIKQLNYSLFGSSNAIILFEPNAISTGLAEQLNQYLSSGGVVLLVPNMNPTDLASIQIFLNPAGINLGSVQKQELKVSRIELKDDLFQKVFSKMPETANLPSVYQSWQISSSLGSARKLIGLNNDLPFLVRAKLGKGFIYVLSSSLKKEASNFSNHALFVPFMLNFPIVHQKANQASFVLGKESGFSFEPKESQNVLTLKGNNQEHLLEVKIKEGEGYAKLNDQIKEAGIYSLGSNQTEWAKIAFNYPRNESVQGFLDTDKLKEKIGAEVLNTDLTTLKSNLEKDLKGDTYWKMALLFALLFLLAEIALIRFLK
ncbi:MAG: BatA and WFA domain-containing protein [Bacteroidia bacterium]|nr:BatA and WFA domain-containing protein [Bacteroidia bacterium]MCF8425218.1 BatA and WFA domain-containing protein [Bacteroidia bacterium]